MFEVAAADIDKQREIRDFCVGLRAVRAALFAAFAGDRSAEQHKRKNKREKFFDFFSHLFAEYSKACNLVWAPALGLIPLVDAEEGVEAAAFIFLIICFDVFLNLVRVDVYS